MLKSGIRGYAAIDCEMVETVGCENALARVSIGKFFLLRDTVNFQVDKVIQFP